MDTALAAKNACYSEAELKDFKTLYIQLQNQLNYEGQDAYLDKNMQVQLKPHAKGAAYPGKEFEVALFGEYQNSLRKIGKLYQDAKFEGNENFKSNELLVNFMKSIDDKSSNSEDFINKTKVKDVIDALAEASKKKYANTSDKKFVLTNGDKYLLEKLLTHAQDRLCSVNKYEQTNKGTALFKADYLQKVKNAPLNVLINTIKTAPIKKDSNIELKPASSLTADLVDSDIAIKSAITENINQLSAWVKKVKSRGASCLAAIRTKSFANKIQGQIQGCNFGRFMDTLGEDNVNNLESVLHFINANERLLNRAVAKAETNLDEMKLEGFIGKTFESLGSGLSCSIIDSANNNEDKKIFIRNLPYNENTNQFNTTGISCRNGLKVFGHDYCKKQYDLISDSLGRGIELKPKKNVDPNLILSIESPKDNSSSSSDLSNDKTNNGNNNYSTQLSDKTNGKGNGDRNLALSTDKSKNNGSSNSDLSGNGSKNNGSSNSDLSSNGSKNNGSSNSDLSSNGSKNNGSSNSDLSGNGSKNNGNSNSDLSSNGSKNNGSSNSDLSDNGSKNNGNSNSDLSNNGAKNNGNSGLVLSSDKSKSNGSSDSDLSSNGSKNNGSSNSDLSSNGSKNNGSSNSDLSSNGSKNNGSSNSDLSSNGSKNNDSSDKNQDQDSSNSNNKKSSCSDIAIKDLKPKKSSNSSSDTESEKMCNAKAKDGFKWNTSSNTCDKPIILSSNENENENKSKLACENKSTATISYKWNSADQSCSKIPSNNDNAGKKSDNDLLDLNNGKANDSNNTNGTGNSDKDSLNLNGGKLNDLNSGNNKSQLKPIKKTPTDNNSLESDQAKCEAKKKDSMAYVWMFEEKECVELLLGEAKAKCEGQKKDGYTYKWSDIDLKCEEKALDQTQNGGTKESCEAQKKDGSIFTWNAETQSCTETPSKIEDKQEDKKDDKKNDEDSEESGRLDCEKQNAEWVEKFNNGTPAEKYRWDGKGCKDMKPAKDSDKKEKLEESVEQEEPQVAPKRAPARFVPINIPSRQIYLMPGMP